MATHSTGEVEEASCLYRCGSHGPAPLCATVLIDLPHSDIGCGGTAVLPAQPYHSGDDLLGLIPVLHKDASFAHHSRRPHSPITLNDIPAQET